jgi:hypothetical protein
MLGSVLIVMNARISFTPRAVLIASFWLLPPVLLIVTFVLRPTTLTAAAIAIASSVVAK